MRNCERLFRFARKDREDVIARSVSDEAISKEGQNYGKRLLRHFVSRNDSPIGGQRGFGLLEALVVVGILGLLGTGLLSALYTNSRATRTLDEQVTATNLASSYFEAIKGLPYADNYTSAGDNITIPSQYSVDIKLQYSDNGTSWVDAYSGQTLQKVSILVSRQGGKPVLSICTYRTDR